MTAEPVTAVSATVSELWFACARPASGEMVVWVFGEGDLLTAELLHDELAELITRSPGPCTVDLSGLSFCDLRGLDALQAAGLSARDAGVVVTWRGASRLLSWLCHTFPADGGAKVRDGL